ncbi:LamG-like jellyroll fold domain-containing protein [Actinoplanes sp. NPDC049118]|uniref:LamG-like jellyroll fold domain-containing protein n=1 Tax=Actinoplanes sp. NPDC049118 TaxID=3155769 RepID=UPI0033EF4CBE
MARHARRLAVLLTFALVASMGIPSGAMSGSFPTDWLHWRWSFGDAATAAVGIPVQKRGPGDDRSHYAGKKRGFDQPAPAKRPAWKSPAAGGENSFDPARSTKVDGRSNASTDVFQNPDGTQTAKVSTGKLNYKGSDGKWRPIDTTLVRGGDGRLKTSANAFGTSLAAPAKPAAAGLRAVDAQARPMAEDLARITLPSGEEFGYGLQGAAAVTPTVKGQEASYPEILPGVDLQMRTLATSLKEILVLKGPTSPREFVYPLHLKGLTPQLTADGAIELRNEAGKVALLIPRPFMEDSSPVGPMGERAKSHDVSYSLIEVDGKPALKVTAGSAWLDDPARVWPVRLDPTANTLNEGDAFVDNEAETTPSDQNGDSLAVGRWQNNIARSFVKFSNFDEDGFVGKRITGAKLWVYLTWASTCDSYRTVYVHKVTEPWTVAEVAAGALAAGPTYTAPIGSSKITDHTPGCTNTAANRSVGQWHAITLDPTTLHDWATNRGGSNWNQGLALTGEEGVTDSWKRFTSGNYSDSYKIYLEMTYANNIAPQVNTLYPSSGTQSATLTPQLIADGYDPDGFPAALEYNFEIYEESETGAQTKIKESGWRTDKTWTVPSGVLKWGGRYRWQVNLNDGRVNEGVPSYTWQPAWRYVLTTPVPQSVITSELEQNGDAGFTAGSGSYTTEATDAQISSVGPTLGINRSYHSMDNRVTGAFGAGWSSMLDAKVTERKDALGALVTVEVTYPTGQTVSYGRNSDGTFSVGLGRYARFTAVTGGYQLVDKSGVSYLFTTGLGTGVYGITSVTDGNGRALNLTYTGGKVSRLTSSATKRNLNVVWAGAHVASVSTDQAVAGDPASVSTWTYTYTGDQLDKVCPPISSTQCTTYGYTDANLYPSTVENLDPYSYWRLADTSGTQATSAAVERMKADVGTYSGVSLGQPGPLGGSTATAVTYNGTSSRTSLPAKLVSQAGHQSVSMWFKTSSTTASDHVLYGQSWDPITQATTKSPYHPVLYIGSNGQLYGGMPTVPNPSSLGSLIGSASGRCLDAESGGSANGKRVVLADCSGTGSQIWSLTADGQLKFVNGTTSRCMRESGSDAGSGVFVQDCSATAADQKWRLTGDGRIASQESGKCLNPSGNGTANATWLTIWTCDRPYQAHQTWSGSVHSPMTAAGAVTDGQWHHVVLSAAGDRQTLYLDGVQKATQVGVKIADIQPRYQYLGAGFLGGGWPSQDNAVSHKNTGSPDFFAGSMSDVAVFDSPLTADRVTELYAARTPRKLLSQVTQPSGVVSAKVQYDRVTGKVAQVTDSNNGVWKLGTPQINGTSQVYASKVLGGNPVDYWRLNDLPGTSEPYNEVNGNTAVNSGAVLGGTAGTDGPFRDTIAPKFTASQVTEITADGSSINTAGSFSASAWVNLTDAAADRQAVAVLGSRSTGFMLGYDKPLNRWIAVMCNADTDTASCPRTASTTVPTASATSWTHLAATFDAPTKTLRLFVNGKLEATTVQAFTPWTATGPLVLGKCRYKGLDCDRWTGRIAEVATFATRLPDAEITAQYNAADRSSTGVAMPASSVSTIDPKGNTSTQLFNLYSGQEIAAIDALGNLTQYGYDLATGTMKLTVDPKGNKTEFVYDARGNVIEQSTWQDQAQPTAKSTTRFTYFPDATTKYPAPDPRNDKLLTIRDARSTGATDNRYLTTYSYDSRGNVTAVTDPRGTTTTTLTDGTTDVPSGLATRETTPGGAVTTTKFASNGDIQEVIDPAGTVTRFAYDGLGRVVSQTGITKSTPSQGLTARIAYDKLGRVVTMTEPAVLNRVTGATHTAVTTFGYNADGQITSTSTADTTGGDATRTETSVYNTLGQLVSDTDAAGNTTTYVYDVYGEVVSETDEAGTTLTTSYDAEGQVLEVKFKNFTGDPDNPSPATDVRSEYRVYDAAGRVVSSTDAMGWVTEFEYTHNNLLTKVTRVDGAKRFVLEENTYDKAGNLTQQVTEDGRTTTTHTIDNAGRPYQSTLDPNGVKRTISQVLSPDDLPLATTVKDAAGVTVGYSESIYDPMGRTLSETTYPTTGSAPVSRWRLGEIEGTTAADSAGNTPAQFSPSDVRWSADHPPARSDLTGSLESNYDGNHGRLTTTGPVVDTKRSYTVSAWARLVNPSGNRAVVSQDGGDYSAFVLGYNGNSKSWRLLTCNNGATNCAEPMSTAPAAVDTWTHLTGVYDATANTVSLYVNGVLQGSAPWGGGNTAAGQFSIGDAKWGADNRTDQWPGKIADVQAYQRALSASEITDVYRGASAAADAQVIRESVQRDTDGAVMSETDANGNVTRYEYDEAGDVAVTIEPAVTTEVHGEAPVKASPISFTGYNTFGEETESKDPSGDVTTVRYDALGRPTTMLLPSYTPPGSSTPVQPQESVEYDEAGQVTKVIDPLGKETSFTYDMLGRVTRETNPDDSTVRYTYNLADDVLSVTDPLGAKQTATYDFLGRQLTGTEIVRQTSASHTTDFTYGAGGWLSKVTSPDKVEESYTYNAVGEIVSTTDGANATTTYQYDGLGQLVRTTLPDGTYSTSSYDLAGRKIAQKSYDAANTLLQSTGMAYDRNGNLTSATDPRGTKNTYTYDATDLMTSQTEPISGSDSILSRFGYDASGRPTRFTDGRGNAFWTTYNTLGQVESRIEPATPAHPDLADRTFTTAYDAAGSPVAEIKPGGVRVNHTYDEMGRLVRSTGTGAESATQDREFDYDKAGHLTSLSGTGGSNILQWDDRGLLTSVSGPSGNSSFTYTADGMVKTRADAAGTTTYGYDTAGRLSSLTNPNTGVQVSSAYNALSQVTKLTYGGTGNTRTFGYDNLHRNTTDELKTPAGASIAKITYGYDANSNMTSKVTAGFAGSAANTYSYDLANRLKTWNNGSATVDYEYDESGNRTKAGAKSFTYDARNRLMNSPSEHKTYEYTARGTLRKTISGTVPLETKADAFDQITRQYSGESTFVDYTYDGLGRALKPGFAYTGLGNDLAADGSALYTRDPAGDLVGIKQSGASVYAWTDRHTDVVGQFTANGASLAGSTTYDPLGAVVASTTNVGNLGFQQEFTEPETGRVNMHARWYNTETGQFDTRDSANLSPFGGSANANRYGYGNGDPLNGIDPSGHSFMTMKGCKGTFSCMLQGFVNAFDFIEMADNFISAFRNLRGAVSGMLGGLADDAQNWSNNIGAAIRDKVDCGAWWMPMKESFCTTAINSLALVGGWACALSGVCQILSDCFGGGSRLACAEMAGGIIADAVKALITAGVGAASRLVSRVDSLIKRFGLPKRAKPGGAKKKGGGDDVKKEKKKKKKKKGGTAKKKKKKEKNKTRNKKDKQPKKEKKKKKKPGKPGNKGGGKPGGGNKGGGKPGGGNKGGGKPSNSKPVDDGPTSDPRRNLPSASDNDGGGHGYDDESHYGTETDCHSFDPATKVLMADGSTKVIADVETGDKVTATDPKTGETTAQPVTTLHKNLDTDLADVTVSTKPVDTSGEAKVAEGQGGRSTRGPTETVLHTTQNHPFWDATAKAWVNAEDLEPGVSTLIGPNGETQYVAAVDTFTGAKEMRDLTVDVIHTYYVLAGQSQVLVHNCGGSEDGHHASCACAAGDQPRMANGRRGSNRVRDPNEPEWGSTERRAEWKKHYNDPNSLLTAAQKAVVKARGYAGPQRINPWTGELETMELSHEPIPFRDGGDVTVPRWPDDHAAIDEFRKLKGNRIPFTNTYPDDD